MIIAMTIAGLFTIAAVTTGLSLLDTWLRARGAYWSVVRERELLDAGFIPQVAASETRLRQPLHHAARRAPTLRRRSGFGGASRSQLGAIQNFA